MMVGYVHDSTTTWRIWDPEFKTTRTQSDVIFDEERNAYISCPQSLKRKHGLEETTEIDIFDLPQEETHIEILDPGGTDEEMAHGRTRKSRAGDSISHGRTRSEKVAPDYTAGADAGLPSHTTGHNHDGQGDRSPPASGAENTGLTHMAPDEDAHTHTLSLDSHDQAPSRDEITTNRSIRRQINSVRRTAAATKKSKAPAIIPTDRITRSWTRANAQVNVSELIHSALASTAVNDDPRTYDEAMTGPLKHEWEAAILEEANSIQRNETFTIINDLNRNYSTATKPIGSKWVFKTKRNPDGSTRYKARLVIKGYEQTDYGETYAPVGKLTTFRILISLAAREGWIIDHLDVVTAFLNP
jgi:hypothetical protein